MAVGQILPIGALTSFFSLRIVALAAYAEITFRFQLMLIKVLGMSLATALLKMPTSAEPEARDVGNSK
jgi:hypothetical protein